MTGDPPPTRVLIHGDFRGVFSGGVREHAREIADRGVLLHPSEKALLFRSESGDDAARKLLADARERKCAKDKLIGALSQLAAGRTSTVDELERPPSDLDDDRPVTHLAEDGVQAVLGYYVGESPVDPTRRVGVRRLIVDRPKVYPLEWGTDPRALRERLHLCASSWLVFHRPDGSGSAPAGCDLGFCPTCLHNRGGSRIRHYLPIFETLAARGYPIVHITATRPADLGGQRPVVLTEYERPLYRHRAAKHQGRAVPGEPLRVALDSLIGPVSGGWRTMTNSRGGGKPVNRRWWRESVVAAFRGTEWTGRASLNRDGVSPPFRLRWHAHLHVLAVLRPGVDVGESTDESGTVAGPWVREWVRRWCTAVPGARPSGQKVQKVGHEGDIVSALLEVLKYPFKPTTCTVGQIGEVLASVRGDHLHVPAGQFHGTSRTMAAVRAAVDGNSQEFPGNFDDDTRRLVADIADGVRERRRRKAEAAVELLYRVRSESEKPRSGEEGRGGAANAPRSDLVGVTVRWLARDLAAFDDQRREMWSYNTGTRSWSGPASVSTGELYQRVTSLSDAA